MTSPAIRTRIAPSPTGKIHIGTIRTALYNWAFARKHEGKFILRIEDTDQKRLVPGAQEEIMQVIKDYGFSWDEGPNIGGRYGPYVQTQRLPIYQKYIQRLLDKGLAYYCFCTPSRLEKMRASQKTKKQKSKYDRRCLSLSPAQINKNLAAAKPFVVRLKVPDDQIIVSRDLIRGEIKIDSNEVDDQILIKSNGIPTYHFAVVIDDHLMKISHVFRGDEWIPSFPKQILLYKYFNWKPPVFIHLPVFLNPEGKGKMSKRHGAVSARSFLDRGYLPIAINNLLMLLGWNPGDEREFFSLKTFTQAFNINHLHKTQPIFNQKKLDYFNGYYIRKISDTKLARLLIPFLPQLKPDIIKQIAPLLKDRITKLSEADCLTDFFHQPIDYPAQLLLQRGANKKLAKNMLAQARQVLAKVNHWHLQLIQQMLLDLIEKNQWNIGRFFMVFRVAICGDTRTLPVVDCLPILGQATTLEKIDIALSKLK